MYMKYMEEKAVNSISKAKIAWLLSTAMKYPWVSMSVKTNICRNIAPPRQLRPNV
jgi:hypothetical protein